MSSEQWSTVIARYQDIYIHSRHAEHARGILNLIPRIREDSAFADLIPSTSLTALCLELPGKNTKVVIWCEKDGVEYSISVQNNAQEEKWTKVADEEIISTLRKCIHKISDE